MKMFLLSILVSAGLAAYLQANYSVDDAVSWVKDYIPADQVPLVNYGVGMLHFERDECAQALSSFQVVVSSYPASEYAPQAQYRIAKCRETLKDYDKAREAYQTFLEKYPSSELKPVAEKDYEGIKFK